MFTEIRTGVRQDDEIMKEIWEAEWQECTRCGQPVMTWAEKEDALCDSCWCKVRLPPQPKDICPYCNQPIEGDGEWDHIIPRCQGGTSENNNLVYCCQKCNHEKSGRTPKQWLGRDVDFSKSRMGDKRFFDWFEECMIARQKARAEE